MRKFRLMNMSKLLQHLRLPLVQDPANTLESHNTLKFKLIRAFKISQMSHMEQNEAFLDQLLQQIKNDSNCSKSYEFLTILLPNIIPIQLGTVYLETSIKYLQSQQYVANNKYLLYFIGHNILRLYDTDRDQFDTMESQLVYNHMLRQLLTLFLKQFQYLQNKFETAFLLQILRVCKRLKVYNSNLQQYFSFKIQLEPTRFNLADILLILNYLAQDRNFPYEYFYRNKGAWAYIIEGHQIYSMKRIQAILRFLELLSKQRFVHCQKIVIRLIQTIEISHLAMDTQQLIQALYYYSRIKVGISLHLLGLLISRIHQELSRVNQKQFSLLVRALANLNYQNQPLLIELKTYNYDLFIASLKMMSKSAIGQVYKVILQNIDKSIQQAGEEKVY